QIPVMGFDEFVDDGVHGVCILLARGGFTNRSKTLEVCLVSSRQVTLLQSRYGSSNQQSAISTQPFSKSGPVPFESGLATPNAGTPLNSKREKRSLAALRDLKKH